MPTETVSTSAHKPGVRTLQSADALGIHDSTLTGDSPQTTVSNTATARLCALRAEPVVLRLSHISKSYPIAGSDDRVVALKDITLVEPDGLLDTQTIVTPAASGEDSLPPPFGPIRRGEFVMIRGPSGGGKTTLLNIIGTIDTCTEGTIDLNNRSISSDTKESDLADIRLKSLGFVFQTFNLIATMTAAENVELPMTLLGKLSAKEIRLRSRQLLTLVGLRNRINHLPSELSGGEQQRVTIARSLANNPSLLLLDEPTGDLDTANTIEIMDLLTRINRRTKTTCIMVTHNPDIECYADRILYVSDGCFSKEVYNTVPTCLNPEKYAKYLAEKEQITMLMAIDESTSFNADDEEPATSLNEPVERPQRYTPSTGTPTGSPHSFVARHSRLHVESGDSPSKNDASVAQLYSSTRDTSLLLPKSSGDQMPSPLLAQTAAARSNPLNSAAVPSLGVSVLAQAVHREEKDARNGI
ncbi:putative ABC transporter domain protein [Leptomonas seymouri]|uniref:Putative ABC transporter domain protein n=1 Tax=Leptomonas seymouri TaxID=5684 RepID=A0A0N1ICD4_LEPSE|nr:putative ABC transporter domain protein [Leptomonas seymouri]|eukprot:KPI90685.1 putative ABC transporter domain protein [Leptomonas seymouri]